LRRRREIQSFHRQDLRVIFDLCLVVLSRIKPFTTENTESTEAIKPFTTEDTESTEDQRNFLILFFSRRSLRLVGEYSVMHAFHQRGLAVGDLEAKPLRVTH